MPLLHSLSLPGPEPFLHLPGCTSPGGKIVFAEVSTPLPHASLYHESAVYARQEGAHCYLETPGGTLTGEAYLPATIDSAARRSYRETRKVPRWSGTSCLLTTPGAARNYYHWTLDLLPKLLLLRELGIDLGTIERFVVNRFHFAFQKESIRRIAPEIESRVVESSACRYAWHDEVIIPLIHRPQKLPVIWPPALRQLPLLLSDSTSPPGSRRLYLTREGAARRRVLNEPEVLGLLHHHDFEAVTMDGKSLQEQAALLRSACAVVAVHGAALTNLIYCHPGTQVIELFSHHRKPFYWILANQLGLSYQALLCAHGPEPTDKIESQASDLVVDIPSLRRAIERSYLPRMG